MYDKEKVAFIDTETTGLHPEFCWIWEIAIITDDTENIFHIDLPRSAHIDEWVRENTRFNDYGNLTDKEPPWVVMEKVHDLLSGKHLVGACPWFDSERLHRLWRQYHPAGNVLNNHNHPWHYHLLDVESLAIGFVTGVTNSFDFPVPLPWNSDELWAKISEVIPANPQEKETRHTAIGDCRHVKEVFDAMFGN